MSDLIGKLPLQGRGIVVTRPERQAGQLADLIRAAGGDPILFPTLKIVGVSDAKPLNRLIDRLDEFDLAIFISPNAVHQAMTRIIARRGMPVKLRVAAVGRGSGKELERFGVSNVIAPHEKFDSEALLDLPELKEVGGLHVVIFRGEGGRELLRDTLSARGAEVEYAVCYRRVMPDLDAKCLMEAWSSGKVHAVVVTSGEGLRNLFDMVGEAGQKLLRNTPTVVPHPRIAATARDLGLNVVIVSEPGDDKLVTQLTQYFSGT